MEDSTLDELEVALETMGLKEWPDPLHKWETMKAAEAALPRGLKKSLLRLIALNLKEKETPPVYRPGY